MKALKRLLSEYPVPYRTDCTLAELTTFKVGGPADLVLYPESVEQCAAIIRIAKEEGKNLIYLGNGSNMLGEDAGCRDWIVKTDRLSTLCLDKNGVMTVGAGVRNVKASSFAAKNAYTGLEFAHGIPGTIGGAVFMNAGAYGGTMDQVVLRTYYLNDEGEVCTLEAKDHGFGYRKSFFMDHPSYLIVGCELQLQKGDPAVIMATINDLQQRRKEKQPLEYASAGSTFKRPEGHFAGKLIEDAGLKGYSVGDAQVSEKHAGFIINCGNATSAEVRQVIADVRAKVLEQFGVELECEVRSLGSK